MTPEIPESILNVACMPLDIVYADPEANLRAVESVELEPDTDLLVLPELFTTGFIKNPRKLAALAEPSEGITVQRIKSMAQERNIAVAGSFLAGDPQGHYFNRSFLILPGGVSAFYDKHHLFSHSGEANVMTAGTEQSRVIAFKGWKIKQFVCYDLRFPVWCRNFDLEYDMALFVCNWPVEREYAFNQLLTSRAIENQAVVVGANRGGEDRFGRYPDEMTCVINQQGRKVSRIGASGVVYARLSRTELDDYRRTFPVWADAD